MQYTSMENRHYFLLYLTSSSSSDDSASSEESPQSHESSESESTVGIFHHEKWWVGKGSANCSTPQTKRLSGMFVLISSPKEEVSSCVWIKTK